MGCSRSAHLPGVSAVARLWIPSRERPGCLLVDGGLFVHGQDRLFPGFLLSPRRLFPCRLFPLLSRMPTISKQCLGSNAGSSLHSTGRQFGWRLLQHTCVSTTLQYVIIHECAQQRTHTWIILSLPLSFLNDDRIAIAGFRASSFDSDVASTAGFDEMSNCDAALEGAGTERSVLLGARPVFFGAGGETRCGIGSLHVPVSSLRSDPVTHFPDGSAELTSILCNFSC